MDRRKEMVTHLYNLGFDTDPDVGAISLVRIPNWEKETMVFDDYLAGVPSIPERLIIDDADFPYLCFADPRPGITRSCALLKVKYQELGYDDHSSEPFDDRFHIPDGPYWFRHDGGRKNRGRRPDHCRDELDGGIRAGTDMEGLFAFAHDPSFFQIENVHFINLPGTVNRLNRDKCAFLVPLSGYEMLGLRGESDSGVERGSSLRVRLK